MTFITSLFFSMNDLEGAVAQNIYRCLMLENVRMLENRDNPCKICKIVSYIPCLEEEGIYWEGRVEI